jgi:hypothetical protein
LAKLFVSSFYNPNLIVFLASKLHIHLTIHCLFYFFLLVLRLLVGQVPSWLGCHAPQDHVDHGSWCIGCYGAASLNGCSRAVNVDSLPQLSYPSSPPKDQGFNPHGSPSLGRPFLLKFMAIIHTAYATIKMPRHNGVITLKSDQHDVVACENVALTHAGRFGEKEA